jgi:ATPase family AAA domain-containing protein 3A/B
MAARQEEMRRKTAEYESELRTKTEIAKAKAETEGRIQQERLNHDLILQKVRLEATERRETVLKGIADGGKLLGEGVASYLNDKEKLRNTAFTITGIAVGVYAARTSIGITGRFVEARLGKPTLVRETSRLSAGQFARDPISSSKRVLGVGVHEQDAMKGIVLEQGLDTQLRKIAVSTAHTKKNRAPFRHLLLHGTYSVNDNCSYFSAPCPTRSHFQYLSCNIGPPGTGKTMFARNLAHHSGLDYAVLTGGDIAPLGRDAVTELHKLFDWAKTSRKGLLLFVDEADAFLQSRETARISEDQRNALNAFLFRTGTESDQFMMVYASNQPAQFDEAVMDRIDEMVAFDLPGPEERKKMITMYIETYLLNPPNRWTRKVETVDIGEKEIEEVVRETEHFSGRAISKLAIAWQAAAYGTDGAILDRATFFKTVEQHKKSMLTKEKWLVDSKKRAQMLTSDL